jgi:hypothetical protein
MTIQSLTSEQRARIAELVEKWTRIGVSTERADRQLAEQSIRDLYKRAGLAAPMIVWTPCPASGIRTAFLLSLCNPRNLAYVLRELAWITSSPPPFQPPRKFSLRDAVMSDMAQAKWRGEPAIPLLARLFEPEMLAIQQIPETVLAQLETAELVEASRAVSFQVFFSVLEAAQAEVITQYELALQWVTEWGVSSVLFSAFNPIAGWWSYSAVRLAGVWVGATFLDIPPNAGGLADVLNDPFGTFSMALWMDYLAEVLCVPVGRSCINLAKSVGWCWPVPHVCVVSERPTVINRDGCGRLHSEDSPSIAYGNGWGVFHWHGVVVPELIIKRPQDISVEMIDKEQNAEIRRVMINRYKDGPQSYLQDRGAQLVHEDRYGKLWRKDRTNDTPLEMVEVLSSTPEVDGSRKTYWLRVKPGFTSAHAAVAWTLGLDSKGYAPMVQT